MILIHLDFRFLFLSVDEDNNHDYILWFENGLLHNEDTAAVSFFRASRYNEYYLYGNKINVKTEEEFLKQSRIIKNSKHM